MTMNRRTALQSIGLGLSLGYQAIPARADDTPIGNSSAILPFADPYDVGFRGPRTLMFLDYFPLLNFWHIKIRQSKAEYVPEGKFTDPYLTTDNAQSQPWSSPFFDEQAKLYRRFSGYTEKYLYESDDAIRWRISPQPQQDFPKKQAPHHVANAPVRGFGSPVYVDPVAEDGYRYKQLVLELHRPSYEYYLNTPDSFFHPLAVAASKKGGLKHFHARKHSMLVSRDGLDWELRRDYDWGCPPLTTEEHYSMFYNHHLGEHVAVYRVRFGDRRLYFTTTKDFRNWSVPRKAIHPDVFDVGSVQFHGSSFHRYDSYYIGLMFKANYMRATYPMGTSYGPDQCHLAYSYDGQHFNQVYREPLIPRDQPGQPEFRTLWTRGMLQKDDKIYLYSRAFTRDRTLPTDFDSPRQSRLAQREVKSIAPHVVHQLRKDGFTYIEPDGWEGEFMTKLMFLFDGKVTMNANATRGRVHYEIVTQPGKDAPEGYSFNDCVPLAYADSTEFQLRFRDKPDLSEFVGQQIYLRFKLHMARFYSIRADFSTDPESRFRAKAGMPIYNTSWLY